MESQQIRQWLFIVMTSLTAVSAVFLTAVTSIFIVCSLKATFSFIIQFIAFVMEVIVAFVAAITSGTTVSMSIVAAACAAAVSFPASSLEGRILVSVLVSSASMMVSAMAVLSLASFKVDMEINVAIVSAAAMSVSFAAAWAVGALSLIEKESHHVGLKITSVLDLVRHNNYRILKLLLKLHLGVKQRDLDVALLHAVKVSFTECAEVLLSSGASADSRDAYDNTPLALACEAGSVKITKMLLDAGADVNLQSGSRGTALHKAANWGYADCVRLLLEHAASPNVQDGLWRTPLMLAVMHAPEVETVARLLIDAGCDVKAVGVEQKTALHHAAERGLHEQIPVLLGAGADLHAVDASRNTALHCAALCGHARVVRGLLQAGCSARALNYQLRTCLHLAAIKGDVSCLSLLHEAFLHAQAAVDATGFLPVWYAVNGGHYEATIFFVRSNCKLYTDALHSSSQSDALHASSQNDTQHASSQSDMLHASSQNDAPRASSQNDTLNASLQNDTLHPSSQNDTPNSSSQSSTNTDRVTHATNPLTTALEKRFMHIARVLVLGGCDVSSLSDWLVALPQNSWTEENYAHVWWLTSFTQNPLQLVHLSRLAIRRHLGTRLLRDFERLPLPKEILRFVCMDELLELEF